MTEHIKAFGTLSSGRVSMNISESMLDGYLQKEEIQEYFLHLMD